MSLIVTVYVPSGIVMASDSRQTVSLQRQDIPNSTPIPIVSSDYVYKTFLLSKNNVGISTFGETFLGGIPMDFYIQKFEEEIVQPHDTVEEITNKLLNFFRTSFPNADTSFHIAGYVKEGKSSVPYVYHINIKRNEKLRVNYSTELRKVVYGASWGGEGDILNEILNPVFIKNPNGNFFEVPKAPILWDAMPLQDAIDFAVYAIQTTIDTMRFQARPKTVGGPIDVLLITMEGSKFIRRKEIR
ncbi:hypothetical protein [Caldisericum exile]|uniref:Uncharacterized protein n=1 Tax=Caldisericum exile (strain DSM 21853 / NBRC 104410 / AZM16c01) TaxID=511051 RepID=A0A7U6JEF6_CALEA|nr:hypothetical protein [Caldisericum exile]BAL80676.1 hypothetical protein CSE_05500 [Caldisericum exile AZM16c01]